MPDFRGEAAPRGVPVDNDPMAGWLARLCFPSLLALGVVAAATALSLAIDANAVTAGFVYLVSVLGAAAWRGFLPGTVASLASTAAFNFFFFAPTGSFHIEDPQNWVSLGGFLVATTIASRLVVRERNRAAESESRQRQIEALYELCLDLFTAGARPGGLDAATGRALRKLGAQGGGLILLDDAPESREGRSWIGEPRDLEVHRLLRKGDHPLPVSRTVPESVWEPRPSGRTPAVRGWRNTQVPVTVEGKPVGHFIAYGTTANAETLEAVARLLGLALERERFLGEQAHLEALRSSDSLKTALLQAVSHDLSTPLTGILVSVQSVKRALADGSDIAAPVDVITNEALRLHRRIRNLLDMARLEAGAAHPHREPTPPADLFRATKEHLPHIVSRRPIDVRVAYACPDLDVDPSLTLEILVNLWRTPTARPPRRPPSSSRRSRSPPTRAASSSRFWTADAVSRRRMTCARGRNRRRPWIRATLRERDSVSRSPTAWPPPSEAR